MSIEDFFKQHNFSDIVFDPVPSYSGEWNFSIENLVRNSKKEDGVNLFQEFHNKTYIKPLMKFFKTERILDLPVKMISMPNENNVGRCLKYSKVDFFASLIMFLDENLDNYGKSKEERTAYVMNLISYFEKDNETLNNVFVEALKEKLRKLKDLVDKEINSEYYEAAMKDYESYKNSMDFSTYIKSLYKITVDFHNGMMNLGDFFDQKIDYKEIYKCFAPDTFYLLFAKIIYEFNLARENETGRLDNSYSYLNYYNLVVGELSKKEKKYDPKIKFTLPMPVGKRLRYSRYQFQQEFNELMKRHPEAHMKVLPKMDAENNEKYRDIGLMEKITKLYEEDTRVNWEFLPDGEGIKRGSSSGTKRDYQKEEKDNDVLINETNMRISILENSGYLGRPVKGLDTFTGYYAFIYSNGKVILEKFWEDEDALKPAVGYATYVMNIDNFIELSKMSRLNLVEYIKTLPEAGVKRIFHTSINNWQRNLNNEISGTYRLEDAIEFINSLKSGEMTHEQ